MDRALSGATIPGQSGPGSNGNEGVLSITQSPCTTGTSPSDILVSYPGHSLGESCLTAEVQSVYSGQYTELLSKLFNFSWKWTWWSEFKPGNDCFTVHKWLLFLPQMWLTCGVDGFFSPGWWKNRLRKGKLEFDSPTNILSQRDNLAPWSWSFKPCQQPFFVTNSM